MAHGIREGRITLRINQDECKRMIADALLGFDLEDHGISFSIGPLREVGNQYELELRLDNTIDCHLPDVKELNGVLEINK